MGGGGDEGYTLTEGRCEAEMEKASASQRIIYDDPLHVEWHLFPLPSHCLGYLGCYMYLPVKGRHQGLFSYFTRGYTRSRLCPLVYSRAPLYYDFPLYISAL